MKTPSIAGLALIAFVLLPSCGDPPRVLQGTVLTVDEPSGLLTIRDERPPAAVWEVDIEGAEIGAPPAPGDLVRVAYRESGGKVRAARVMNLTRQAELRSGGGH